MFWAVDIVGILLASAMSRSRKDGWRGTCLEVTTTPANGKTQFSLTTLFLVFTSFGTGGVLRWSVRLRLVKLRSLKHEFEEDHRRRNGSDRRWEEQLHQNVNAE